MRLSRRALDAYNAAIKKQGGNAEDAARKALEAWFEENPDASVAEAREFSIVLMNEVGSFYGNASGDLAYELRDIAAEAAGIEVPPVDYEYAPEAKYVEDAAHYQAGKLKTGDRRGFVDGIAKASRYFAERGANDTMAAFGQADGKKFGKRVRFARIPTGAVTCSYCCMLASRGFVYKAGLSALNANHLNCDCRIVEGFDGMTVEGYDPDSYYRIWKRIEDAEVIDNHFYNENQEDIIKQINAYEKEFNKRWIDYKRQGKKNSASYRLNVDAYFAEITNGNLHAENFTHLEGKEILLGKWFADSGQDVIFARPKNDGRRYDAVINGLPWEFKQIVSSDPLKIHDRIMNGKGQSENIVIDLSLSDIDKKDALAQAAFALELDDVKTILIVKNHQLILLEK